MKKDTHTPTSGFFGSASPAQDGFDFLKRMWGGGMTLPGMMTPTTDLNELEKRIADLKAVEQWLNLNLSMLRATIQGLEVQHGTLAALQAFGNSLHTPAANTPPSPQPEAKAETPHNTQAIEEASTSMVNTATAWWNLMQEQFHSMAQSHTSNPDTHAKASPTEPAPEPAPEAPQVSPTSKPSAKAATQAKAAGPAKAPNKAPKAAPKASGKAQPKRSKTTATGKPSHDV